MGGESAEAWPCIRKWRLKHRAVADSLEEEYVGTPYGAGQIMLHEKISLGHKTNPGGNNCSGPKGLCK
jgi:hypothetical protein